METKIYRRGELMEVLFDNQWFSISEIKRKRIITTSGLRLKFAEVEGWHLPWGYTIAANVHMIDPMARPVRMERLSKTAI